MMAPHETGRHPGRHNATHSPLRLPQAVSSSSPFSVLRARRGRPTDGVTMRGNAVGADPEAWSIAEADAEGADVHHGTGPGRDPTHCASGSLPRGRCRARRPSKRVLSLGRVKVVDAFGIPWELPPGSLGPAKGWTRSARPDWVRRTYCCSRRTRQRWPVPRWNGSCWGWTRTPTCCGQWRTSLKRSTPPPCPPGAWWCSGAGCWPALRLPFDVITPAGVMAEQ